MTLKDFKAKPLSGLHRVTRLTLPVIIVASMACSARATAVSLPPAYTFYELYNIYTGSAAGETVLQQAPNPSFTFGGFSSDDSSISSYISPFPGISAYGASIPFTAYVCGCAPINLNTEIVAAGYLDYYAEVIGPETNALIPVDLAVNLAASVSGTANASAAANFYTGVFQTAGVDAMGSSAADITTLSGVTYVNTPVGIDLRVDVDIGGGQYAGSGSAFADPYFYIDPSFSQVDPSYRSDYSVVLSPGVVNAVSAAPEPSAWALMITGVALAAFSLRRRRVLVLS